MTAKSETRPVLAGRLSRIQSVSSRTAEASAATMQGKVQRRRGVALERERAV